MDTRKKQQEIDNAKAILKSYGYYVENLWHIEDVFPKNDCSDDDAYDILDDAMQNDATYEQVWMAIDCAIDKVKRN
jgi:muramoyltetrapeptide carboxypeptidase LdcA involved in peptidoglycan recycling